MAEGLVLLGQEGGEKDMCFHWREVTVDNAREECGGELGIINSMRS